MSLNGEAFIVQSQHAISRDFPFLSARDHRCQPAFPPCLDMVRDFRFYRDPWRLLPDRFSQFIVRPLYFAILLAFLLGAWRYQAAQPKINAFQVAFYNDRKYDLLITGSLAEPPDYRNTYTNLKIKVAAVDSGSGDLPVSGLMLARVPENQIYGYGVRVRLRGQLETPPQDEEFSYRDYLAREGILSYMSMAEVTVLPGDDGGLYKTAVYKLKEKLLKNTYRLFNDPEASLLAGILLGVDTGLTKELQNAFKNTGTAHIIAISGFNIAIIGGIFFSIFKNIFRERRGALLAVVSIFLYGDSSSTYTNKT